MQLIAVVVNWNGGEDTLASLASLEGIPAICVDNGSTDGSDRAVEERFPQVELLRTGANLGFAGGNNVGIRRAFERGADWVLLLNNDAVAEPGLGGAIARGAEARPDAGILACKILFEKGRTLQYAGAKFNPRLGYSGRLAGYGKEDRGNGVLRDVGRADGAALALSRAAYDSVGGLDESLFMYVEDVELSFRVRRAVFAVVFVPDARVRHKGSAASGGRASTTSLFYSVRNTIAVSERYAPLPRGLRSLRRAVVVGAHLMQAMSHPARRDASRAVIDGWLAARAGRSGQR